MGIGLKRLEKTLDAGDGGWGNHLFGLNGHVRPNRVWLSEP